MLMTQQNVLIESIYDLLAAYHPADAEGFRRTYVEYYVVSDPNARLLFKIDLEKEQESAAKKLISVLKSAKDILNLKNLSEEERNHLENAYQVLSTALHEALLPASLNRVSNS